MALWNGLFAGAGVWLGRALVREAGVALTGKPAFGWEHTTVLLVSALLFAAPAAALGAWVLGRVIDFFLPEQPEGPRGR